jgi:hypothetical protein
MDMLAKVAAVTVVASGAVVASALSYGLLKGAVLEPKVRMGRTVPAFAAELKLPDTPLFAPMAPPKAVETAAAERDLASAMSAALTRPRKKLAAVPAAPPPPAAAAETSGLDLGFKAPARSANLGERAVKSTSVQQTGGAERQRVATSDDARVHFDVDLAAPR